MDAKNSSIKFDVNERKALEAIVYVLSKRATVNVYNLLKVIYAADKYHLNNEARPVTGDVYIKMPYGTVPSVIYDMTKLESLPLACTGLDEYPFEKVNGHDLKAKRTPDLSFFSESDIEALEYGIKEYIDLAFKEVEQKNHSEKCWIEGELNSPISYESMIENPEILKYLNENKLRIVV